MIELRMVNKVNPQSASVAYVYSPVSSVLENVSLADYSYTRTENSVDLYQTDSSIEFSTKTGARNTYLLSNNIVVGNRSVLSKSVPIGKKLFYVYYIGRWASVVTSDPNATGYTITTNGYTLTTDAGTPYSYPYTDRPVREVVKSVTDEFATNDTKLYTLYPSVADFEVGSFVGDEIIKNATYFRVYNTSASQVDMDAARDTIKNTIEILADGEKTNDLAWDITVDSYETNGFLVRLYVDKLPDYGKTYQVRYPGISQGGTIGNRLEVINAQPYLLEEYNYDLTATNGKWTINDGTIPLPNAMAIGVFGAGSVTVSTTTITIGSTIYTYTGKSLTQVVSDLNSQIPTHVFTLLNDKDDLDATSLATGTFTILPSGISIDLYQEINIRSGHSTRIQPLLPYNEPSHRSWYPRINNGVFTEVYYDDVTDYLNEISGPYVGRTKYDYKFTVPEYSTQTFRSYLGVGYKSIALEVPIIESRFIIRTRRFPLESNGSIRLRNGSLDISSVIKDIDIQNGFIFLTTPVSSFRELNIEYTYYERSYVYTGIDINPINNPGILGKFIGLYIVPTEVTLMWTDTTSVYHVVMDTAKDIVDAVEALTFANGVSARALLLGIYQVIPTVDKNEIEFVNTEVFGGGIKDSIALTKEAKFIADAGRFDGEPFDAEQTLIARVDSSVFGTGPSSTTYDPTYAFDIMNPTGLFTTEEVADKIKKWAAAGTLPIVEPTDT